MAELFFTLEALTIQATVILTLAILVSWAPKNAARRHHILFAGLLCVSLLPLAQIFLPTWEIHLSPPEQLQIAIASPQLPQQVQSFDLTNPTMANSTNPTAVSTTSQSLNLEPSKTNNKATLVDADAAHVLSATTFSWRRMTVGIWILGASFVGIRFVIAITVLRRDLAGADHLADARINEVSNDIAQRLKVKRTIYLASSANCRMPMTWGTIRPVILLPDSCTDWSEEELNAVLTHEIAHISRLESLSHYVAQCALVIGWFHPLVWWANSRMRYEAECAADDIVLSNGAGPSAYVETLLKFSTRQSVRFGGALAMAASPLTARVIHILDPVRSRMTVSASFRAVVLAFAACILLLVVVIRPVDGVAPQRSVINISSEADLQPAEELILGDDVGRLWGNISLAVTADGKRVFLPGPLGFVSLYDAETLEFVYRFQAHKDRCLQIQLVDDGGQVISVGTDGHLRLWDVIGEPNLLDEFDLAGNPDEDNWMRIAGDRSGTRAVVSSDKLLALVDVKQSKLVVRHRTEVERAFGHFILTADGTRMLSAINTDDATRSIEFDGSGYGLGTAQLTLWDVTASTPVKLDETKIDSMQDLQVLSGSNTILGLEHFFVPQRKMPRWSFDGDKLTPLSALPAWGDVVARPALDAAGKDMMAIQVLDKTLVLKLAENEASPVTIPQKTVGLTFLPGSDSVITTTIDRLEKWDLIDGVYQLRNKPSGHQKAVNSILFDEYRRQVISSDGDQVLLWNWDERNEKLKLTMLKLQGGQLQNVDNGKRFLISRFSSVSVVERLSTGFDVKHSLDFGDNYRDAAWCADIHPRSNVLVTGHWDSAIRFWQLDNNTVPVMQSEIKNAHRGHVCDVDFSPSGDRLASGGWDHKVKLFDTSGANPVLLVELGSHDDVVREVEFSPDGRWLASGGEDGRVVLWDMENIGRAHTVFRHAEDPEPYNRNQAQRTINSLEFSFDGLRLLSSDGAGRVTLWSLDSGEAEQVWRQPGWVWTATFVDDQKYVASGNGNGTVSIWKVPPTR